MGPRPLGLAILCVVIVACGGGAPASTAPSSSASGSIKLVADVDVGGRTMQLVCVGPTDKGLPTILLEAGGGGDYLWWDQILPAMQATHRLCAYDRAGLGQSQPPVEASRTTAVGHRPSQAAGCGPRERALRHWVDSYGATVAILFTRAPDRVVGLLFVDSQSPRVTARWRAALPKPTADEPASLHQFRPVVVLSAGKTPGSQMGLASDLATTVDEIWAVAQ
jgi:pimeloyl-ACP methyl ester carboxylesterase